MRHVCMKLLRIPLLLTGLATLGILFGSTGAALADGNGFFLSHLNKIKQLATTVPANGDVNPYGVAVVPNSIGDLVRGHVLVSNFNNSDNLQGTGTTIVQISPGGKTSLFAQLDPTKLNCPGGIGLTTALVALQRGWVIVGSLPTNAGAFANPPESGCLIVLNSWGQAVETFTGNGINGPWDMTAFDQRDDATLFVTNVLNGIDPTSPNVVNQGTVLRIRLEVPEQGYGRLPSITSTTTIGSTFSERTDPNALIVGPTGVGLRWDGTLYVADSVNSRIAAIPDALTRHTTAFSGNTVSTNGALNDPLGLTIAPNGNILTVNGNDGFIVETTPGGKQVASKLIDNTPTTGEPNGFGCLFGLALIGRDDGVYFVDDCTNTLNTLK
ncbi:MAG TPA: hypothetical protein VFU32_14200 [Ktedonobacterales bacterium]|nr:hypothetical protein [Ktedonobacterales bacterium]